MDTAVAKRSQKWDILKLILIFLVVLGHGVDYFTRSSEFMKGLFLFIYSFHIPVFIFVSGVFSKNTVNQKRFDRIFGYLILYFAVKLYPVIYRNLSGGKSGINWWSESGIPWFMFALFVFYIVTILLRKLPRVAVLTVSLLAGCAVGYFSFIGDFLVTSRIIVYYPFFFLGYCVEREQIENICRKKSMKIASLLVLTVFFAAVLMCSDELYWLRPLLTGRNPFSALGQYENLGFIIRLAYYLFVLVIGGSVVSVIPDRDVSGVCAKLGQRTLAVYALHFIVFYFLFEKFVFIPDDIKRWLVLPASVLATLFFSIGFFNRILMFLLDLPGKLIRIVSEKRIVK